MPPGKKRKANGKRKPERNQNDERQVRQIVDQHPAMPFVKIANVKFEIGDFSGALQDFNKVLDILDQSSTTAPQRRVSALLGKAACLHILVSSSLLREMTVHYLGHFDDSVENCTIAFNLSKESGFENGISDSVKMIARNIVLIEKTGDIRRAFQLAVSLKTMHFTTAKAHVGRLRGKLVCIFREDFTLANELRDNLMHTGTEFFAKECFQEAAEYFSEVVRLVCEFNFDREAYVYQAKCFFKLERYDETRASCMEVLKRIPDDEEARNLVESINAIIQEQSGFKRGTKKKKSPSTSNSPVPEEPVAPENKPMNKKQRNYEEHRRKKELEEISEQIHNKIDKDREKQEQKIDEKNKETGGTKSLPSFDVKAAMEATSSRRETPEKQTKVQAVVGPGARPKQRRVNKISGTTKDRNSTIKKQTHIDASFSKNDRAFCEKRSSREFNPPRRSFPKQDVPGEQRLSLCDDDSFDSECRVSNTNCETTAVMSKKEDGWTLVESKSRKPKSVAETTLYQNQHAFQSIGISQDASTCKESNWRKHESKSRDTIGPNWRSLSEHSSAGGSSSTQGSNTSTRKRFSSSSQPQDFPTDHEAFLPQNATSTGFGASRMPGLFSEPSFNGSATKKTAGVRNRPKSQWETLEQISPLQFHQTFDLVNSNNNTAVTKESELPLDTDASSQVGFNSRKVLPEGVFPLCAHFLQENKKGQAFQRPKPCSKCTKNSKLFYGTWRSSKKEWQVMRPYPKDVNYHVPFKLCSYFSNGVKCQKSPCTFAHGTEELSFWTKERKSDHASFGRIADPNTSQDESDFDNPKPQERIQGSLIIRDMRTNTPRSPPTGVYNGNWWKSGRKCRSDGNDELKSWIGHKNEIEETRGEENKTETNAETTRSNQEQTEPNAGITRSEMVYVLPGVEVSSNKPATVIFPRGDKRRHAFDWIFTVTFEISEVGKLCQIDLLHRYHKCYRLTEIKGFYNNMEIFSRVPKVTERWSYRLPSWIDMKQGQMKVAVSVSFETTTLNQTFTQCLKFDFGKKPYLLQGLNVDIASEEALDTISTTRQKLKLDPSVWIAGSVDIVPSAETAEMSARDVLLQEKYKLPERIENVVSAQIIDGNMTVENYKRVMHQLLFTEELFMKKAISSFVFHNVPLHCQQSVFNERTGVVFAENGELFGILKFQENESLQPDDAAGRLVIRNVKSAWLKMAGTSSQKVYEVFIQKVESESVALKLSSRMCLDLQLSDAGNISVDVQFQLNRQPLCEWHAAIDRLGTIQLSLLFPKLNAPQVKLVNQEYVFPSLKERRPWNWLRLDRKLNTNQEQVIRRILAPGNYSSPLVVFGPFGTGKTFTLNQAIRHLVTTKHNRILLCTHTNSAADIHVRLLHDYLTNGKGLQATRPLRIYQTNRRLNANSEIAKEYGLIENNAYVLPTREEVIKYRVVITTLAMSKHLLDLQLNHGFFTHILVDEAAQALEPEALIPLALAGPNTKVVFTGDHMQMSPEVYSHYARRWGLQRSLPERLFDHYYENKQSDCSVMLLTENYRCHPDILQFPSDNFYGEELIARSDQVAHPRLGPLLFFSVCGVEEARENSYINEAEVEEVVKRVKELANDWPEEWKEKDLSQIGVISAYMTQVKAIRTYLRSHELQKVTVESIHNVQGKEFRALFISTVRTSLTCHSFDVRENESQPLYWEFLSDPKLLNTAITRAMSLVAVVGEPVSLCTAGDCRGNWRDYIKRCHKQGTLYGASYDEIKKKIDAPLSKITLNPQAAVFVPKPVDNSSREVKSSQSAIHIQPGEISRFEESLSDLDDNHNARSLSDIEDRYLISTAYNLSGIEMVGTEEHLSQGESTSDEGEEQNSPKNDTSSVTRPEDIVSQHQVDCTLQEEPISRTELEQGEDDAKQNASEGFEEFSRESFEDETVFPRYLDKIIKALVEKCKETKEKELSKDMAFPSLHTATTSSNKKSKSAKHSGKRSSQQRASFIDYSPEDYEIYFVNGRPEVRILNLGFHQTHSSRHQRLTAHFGQNDSLDSQLLQRLLLEKPNTYLRCTLRLNSEIVRTAYAEVADTQTPDIKIKGRVRGVFDMDHVVVEKTDIQPSSGDGVPRCQGKIAGVLNHIIRPHERQYVCNVDYENPEVMIPINKSVSKIVNFSPKGLEGFPVYKEIRHGNEKLVKVELMDIREVLSGKFLFLVQYLQWRSDCPSPLGIVIRKLPQGNTLSNSMKILFAEHGVRESFRRDCKDEVKTKFPPEWSIPTEEYQIRQKIDGAFTIDPDNSKDLDDALTLEQLPDSVNRVGVHIADVSYFVEPGTQLDKEALFRCTSYYPDHCYQSVPMLPRELSENHCSLLPGKDRLCFSVFLDLSEKGELVGQPQIKRTIARSSCQLTYTEAQKIIDGQEISLQQLPKNVEKNIQDLSALAQRRRKLRLRDAGCDHWSNSDDGEDFEAHELVEEMMLLANEEIAKFLSAQVPEMAPLRTQLPPKDHKLKDWLRKYGQFIKYSLFLRGFYTEETLKKMSNDVSESEAPEFKVQESIWFELCGAAESGNQAKLQKLICNESNHPQLAVANSQFQRIQPKSQYICEKDQPEENVVHFSLGMRCYTHFTSPIRRYIDIQVHRLVLALISQSRSTNKSSKEQVAEVCRRSTFAQDNSRKFKRACSRVHLAAKLKENSLETAAVIALIEKEAITFEIPSQEYNHLSKRQRRIKLSNLNPFDVNVEENGSKIVLTWKLRLYIAPTENIIEDAKKEREKVIILLSQGFVGKGEFLNLPADKWLQILKAFQEKRFKELKMLIRKTERDRQLPTRLPGLDRPRNTEKAEQNTEHFYEKKLSLATFDSANVQLTAHMTHGVFHPEIQLFKINPSVHICVEHRKYPRECFATTSRYPASRKKYSSVDNYINAWKPVLAMEAATVAVDESDEFAIHHLHVQWKKEINGNPEGSFSLRNEYCECRQIEFHPGDFVCIRVREDSATRKTRSETTFTSAERTTSQEETNLLNEEPFDVTQSAVTTSGGNSRHESGCMSDSFWVGHCIIKHSKLSKTDTLEITMDLHQCASDFPEELLSGGGHLSTLSLIHRSLPHRRMFSALYSLPSASQLVHSICLGHELSQEGLEPLPSSNLSIVKEHPKCQFQPLNRYQREAVKEALAKPFTLVLGPPGTGKTVTGVHIAYWFAKRNKQMQLQRNQDSANANKSKAPPQVNYCGPSNKSVDVVAKYMLKIPELKIIRVYSHRKEQADFPIPNKRQPLKYSTDEEDHISDEDAELKTVSLHHIIRSDQCPFASELREYEHKFKADKKEGRRTSDKEVKEYRELIGKAEDWALRLSGAQIILCTCAVAGMPRIANSCRDNIKQCIVDECGMCMELESLVPISCLGVQQVVLIGDHKQLQPVIKDNLAMTLGLNVSMFERLSERAKMLELQYRMQEEICKFPSNYFYEGRLKTDPSVPTRDPRLQSFWPGHTSRSGKNVPMAFCHVEGEEVSSAIKTAHSNEQSKANEKEVKKVVHVARSLVCRNNVDASKVVILSPYREQRSRISEALKKVFLCKDILVTTIAKSQGSEWDYVILSLVRSLSKDELDPEPTLYWLREHLGFLTDEHQMNVGLTRARKGLCIIGNKNLLMLHPMWQKLIEFYEENQCLVNESDWPRN